jgi:hypothetical protein
MQQIYAGFHCPLDLGGRLAAFRNFVPSRIGHARALEGATQLQEASANGLSFVRDDPDLHAAPDWRSAAAAARATSTSAHKLATPTTTPPATSSGWCMPRYIRDAASSTTIATAIDQIATVNVRFRMAEVNRRASPQYTAIAAAV